MAGTTRRTAELGVRSDGRLVDAVSEQRFASELQSVLTPMTGGIERRNRRHGFEPLLGTSGRLTSAVNVTSRAGMGAERTASP